jgi:uncharacterized membrane protein YhfC
MTKILFGRKLMLTTAYLLSATGMLVLPIVLAFYLTRKFSLSWKLVLAGAVTFIASQVLHIPVVYGLTALFTNDILSIPSSWTLLFNAIVLGLLAGIFEETARWILYKFILKDAKTWNEGVLVGVGHGGVEAVILGALALTSVVSMIAMRNADLTAFGIPADQLELAQKQVADFWSAPVYMAFLGLIERVFAVCLHLSLSVMVLYSVVYRKPVWFWIALLWHAIVDALAVYLMPTIGALGIEAVVGICAVISLTILFRMRPMFLPAPVDSLALENQ